MGWTPDEQDELHKTWLRYPGGFGDEGARLDVLAVATRAVELKAACGGTMTAALITQARKEAKRLDSGRDLRLLVLELTDHAAAQGATVATLQARVAELEDNARRLTDERNAAETSAGDADAARDAALAKVAEMEAWRDGVLNDLRVLKKALAHGVEPETSARKSTDGAISDVFDQWAHVVRAGIVDAEQLTSVRSALSRLAAGAQEASASAWKKRLEAAAEVLADVAPGELGRLDIAGRARKLRSEMDDWKAEANNQNANYWRVQQERDAARADVEGMKANLELATRKANEKHDALLDAESRLAEIRKRGASEMNRLERDDLDIFAKRLRWVLDGDAPPCVACGQEPATALEQDPPALGAKCAAEVRDTSTHGDYGGELREKHEEPNHSILSKGSDAPVGQKRDAERDDDMLCPRGPHHVAEHERGGTHPLCGADRPASSWAPTDDGALESVPDGCSDQLGGTLDPTAGLPEPASKVTIRYPCSATCTHDDAATPGHPERVKARSGAVKAFQKQCPLCKGKGTCRDVDQWPNPTRTMSEPCIACHGSSSVQEEGQERSEAAISTLADARPETDESAAAIEEAAEANAYDRGAEAMRAACWESLQPFMSKHGFSPSEMAEAKAAIEGATP